MKINWWIYIYRTFRTPSIWYKEASGFGPSTSSSAWGSTLSGEQVCLNFHKTRNPLLFINEFDIILNKKIMCQFHQCLTCSVYTCRSQMSKKDSQVVSFLGSAHVKAVRKMLMKMTPSDAIIDWSFRLLKFLRPSEKWAILEIFGLTCKKYYKINS